MGVDSLWDGFVASLPVIGKAWPTVIGLIIVALVVGFAAGRFMFSERIATLKGRIEARDEKISDYDQKLEGASPDEARKRIEALELQVKALSPRRLTEEQKTVMVRSLAGVRANIGIGKDMAVADASAFTGDLASVFQQAGWGVSLPAFLGMGGPQPSSGLGFEIDNNNPQQAERAVQTAMAAAGLRFDALPPRPRPQRPSPPPGVAIPPQPAPPDVRLVVTTKLA
ncbi:MAG: hypothetical protein KGL39_51575 [Patescibacteria group bacterium]|nr:hypothetical protein [Patescibacteria group bacterium]